MNYWSPLLWKNTFQSVKDSKLDYRDQWTLNFNYSQTQDISYEEQRRGWMVCEHWAYGSFCCSYCSWEWDSHVMVLFRYRRQSASRRGTVIMRTYRQGCQYCGTFVLPGFFKRQVEIALEHLSVDIRSNCYIREEIRIHAGPLMKTFDSVVACPGYAQTKHKVWYVLTNLAVTHQEKGQIERDTVGQSRNPLWSAYRKNRITSSNFGLVLAADYRQSYPPSLFRTLQEQCNLSGVEAIQYGIRNEPRAKQQYTQRTGMYIQERGVFLSESGLLGASPDGTVYDGDRIIEVKCPWSARGKTVRQAAAEITGFFLELDKDRALTLKPNHNYWHQIQGTLHLSGANYCDLVIWTPLDLVILSVPKSPTWARSNIVILETFYEDVFLPHVLSQM